VGAIFFGGDEVTVRGTVTRGFEAVAS